ncbi:prepilin peptidase [Trujillonella endophytica]|uniref:Leader peptidase (Prepilin peptidase) / N-methyltransferase n=1 Tax=Trujillonella endophytica TaxID=673521 RepID=A0A1H8TX78_9ACTN|nr:prepilin peptidase [Trujillella endophytica]SEO95497.1 leader peptidase (prepilin peptidase) / N-methyltransferase [Trujillella endophytica]
MGVGPWLARCSVRLARRDGGAAPGPVRVLVTSALFGGLVAGVLALTGVRPAAVALAWAAGAGVVLAAVDLAVHRLPDRVLLPAAAACATALLVDAPATGSWSALGRAALACGAAFALAAGARVASPEGLGFGDVKLLGLLGLLLGWAGWGVLLAGVFLGLLTGAAVSLLLVATRRAGWRTAVPFGPPLLAGAVLALALAH